MAMNNRITKLLAGALATAALLVAAPAPAMAGSSGESRAEAVLERAERLLEPTDAAKAAPTPSATKGRALSALLAKLAALEPKLDGDRARAARAILARPDDGDDDRYGDGFSGPEAAESPACTTNFCVHWVDSTSGLDPGNDQLEDEADSDMDDIPDFIEEVQDSAEESFDVENGDLGWAEPLSDGLRGGGPAGRTDVYLIETNGQYFGYASPDEGQGQVASKWAYLVLDNGYSEFQSGALSEVDAMRVTMAHEYNHVLQFTLDSLQDVWMFESTATWAENHVYPGIDDYINYVPDFAGASTVPLDSNGLASVRVYGAAMWNHFLEGTQGAAVIREAWEDSDAVTPAHRSIPAYDSALGGSGFPFAAMSDAFAEFTSTTPEWRATPSVYPDTAELPDVSRSARLKPNGRPIRGKLDHLSYALMSIRPGVASDDGLKLRVRAPEGVSFSIDLVARTGSATAGTVEHSGPVGDSDGQASTVLDPGSYDRVTAVIANSDARVSDSGRYPADNSQFAIKLSRPGD